MTNYLYYGDNLVVLRESIKDESIDLIYLDPPFNSKATYNVLFRSPMGEDSQAQLEAFEDTWHWTEEAARAFDEVLHSGNTDVAEMLDSMRRFMKENDMMAYLTMMAVRLLELHRVLKQTGSLYLHCDPTASHYLKVLLDAVFGHENFRNEIIWRRTGAHSKLKRWGPIHDVIFYYTKSNARKWRYPKHPYMRGHVEQYFKKDEKGYKTAYYGNVLTGSGTRNGESGQPWQGFDPTAKGRHWAIPGKLLEGISQDTFEMGQHEKLDLLLELGHIKIVPGQAWPMYEHYVTPADGIPTGDIWAYQPYTDGTVFGTDDSIDDDVSWLKPQDAERLGYPTQKPLGLLERIIGASSAPGEVVMDPFCGCGTAVHAAQKMNRSWIGIDITHLAIGVIELRLKAAWPNIQFDVIGTPKSIDGAYDLAKRNKDQFQWWAVSLVGGHAYKGKKKGADSGIDGILYFKTSGGKDEKAIISVKGGGHVGVAMVRDLRAVVEREKAKIGLFVTLTAPTKPMMTEAFGAGFFDSGYGKHQKIQIWTVAALMEGKKPDIPLVAIGKGFKQAQKEYGEDTQKTLL